MVFELTDSLINESVVNTKDIRDSLHNLFLGYEEGNLILSLSPDLLNFLDSRLTDSLSKRVINYLKNKALARYDVLWNTKIVLDNPNYENHELSIRFFRKSSTVQPPILLCENLRDTRFYFALCKEYFGIEFINTKRVLGGGGSATADSLESIVNLFDCFCLCIVDSDMKYPGSEDGGTYRAIQNKNLLPNPTFYVYKLNVHEIENLIPLDSICQHIKDRKGRLFAKKLKWADKDGDILKYYDIKNGIELETIQKDELYRNFAEMIYARLGKRPSFNKYLSTIRDGQVFRHLCPGIVDAILKPITRRNEPRFIYCDYLREEWDSIQKFIVTFFCARNDDPIN